MPRLPSRRAFVPACAAVPRLAPGNALVDSHNRLAVALGRRIEDGALNEISVPALAAEMGISDRHLRRVIQDEFGVSPNKLLETQRLLTAKLLLTDTTLPVTEVAYASGFCQPAALQRRFQDQLSPESRASSVAAPAVPKAADDSLSILPTGRRWIGTRCCISWSSGFTTASKRSSIRAICAP